MDIACFNTNIVYGACLDHSTYLTPAARARATAIATATLAKLLAALRAASHCTQHSRIRLRVVDTAHQLLTSLSPS